MSNPLQKPEILENFFFTQPDYQKNQEKALDLFLKTHPKKASQTFWQQFSQPIFNFTLPKFLRLSLTVFCLFCVIFTLSFASVITYSQVTKNEEESSANLLNKNGQKSPECKKIEVNYKGNLKVEKKDWYFSTDNISIQEQKYSSDEIEAQRTKPRSGLDDLYSKRNASVMVSCSGVYTSQEINNFYKEMNSDLYPDWTEYQECAFNRMIRFWKNNDDYYCGGVDGSHAAVEEIGTDHLPFLDESSRQTIQKYKIYRKDADSNGNNYIKNSNTYIFFFDENNVGYQFNYYLHDAEYMVRNYDLEISLK